MCSSEDELVPPSSELKRLPSRKIRSLINAGEKELARLRLYFEGDSEVSYTNPDDPVSRQMRIVDASLRALKLEAVGRGMSLTTEQPTTDKPLERARKGLLRARDLDARKRRDAIAQMVRTAGKRPTTEVICKKLASLDVDIPENWQEKYEVRSWIEAYANPKVRPLVDKMISADIAGLRENGTIS